jgi:hypothetical protein
VIVTSMQPVEGAGCDMFPVPGELVSASVPADLVDVWSQAYRDYGRASELLAERGSGEQHAAQAMAQASRAVAGAWRRLGAASGHAWWSLAAVETAAQAFEFQAQDWAARAGQVRVSRRRGGR